MTLCEKCQQLTDGFLNEDLSDDEKAFFNQHIIECADCQQALNGYQDLAKELALWAHAEVSPPPDFRVQLMEKLSADAQEGVSTKVSWFKRYSRRLLPVALAAVLMVALLPAVLHNSDMAIGRFGNREMLLNDPADGQAVLNEALSLKENSQDMVSLEQAPASLEESPKAVSAPQEQSGEIALADAKGSGALAPEGVPAPMMLDASESAASGMAVKDVPISDAPLEESHNQTRGRSAAGGSDEWASRLELVTENLAILEGEKEDLEAEAIISPSEALAAELETVNKEIERTQDILKAVEEKDLPQYEKLIQLND